MRARSTDADGFSLIEIVIAMFLLMLLALAVLPALIGAARASTVNSALLAATTFANAQLAPIHADFPDDPVVPTSCATLRGYEAVPGPTDPATGLRADIEVGSCPASGFPVAVAVTVTVVDPSSPTDAIVTIPTKVVVSEP